MKYKWNIKEAHNITDEFLKVALNSQIIAKLLINRGIDTPEKAKEYLEPKSYIKSNPEEIPFLNLAKERIIEAINKNEKIIIFGDYDVDGVTSTSCLLIALKQFTNNISFYIPNRITEGYGLNKEAIKKFAKEKTNLLITCDCGVTNHEEIKLANELKIDVIVTDHHSLPEELPPACAVLNPKLLPEKHKLHFLPGVGVAYKLAEALLTDERFINKKNINPESLLDLVCLGMIADLAPLVDENRYLVQCGLEKLANTEKIGLRELLKVCGVLKTENNKSDSINAEHVGFGIAPRINAVGRLTDANLAVKLFTTENEIEALHLACELDIQNKERQIICEETLKDALSLIDTNNLKKDKCIILAKEGWHHGVIGIVASRIVEKFHLPTILIAIDKDENIAKGSGRSIDAVNITEILNKCKDNLERFGGHKAACGLSLNPENINIFIESFKKYINEILENKNLDPNLKIDLEIPIADINFDLIEKINMLAPFGLGNKMPIFCSKEIEIANVRNIGKNNQHLKLFLKDLKSQRFFEGLIWNHEDELNPKDQFNIAYSPKLNNFNGETSIQIEIKDHEILKRNKNQSDNNLKSIIIHDYRKKENELVFQAVGKEESLCFFAEALQKDLLPLKTFSRNSVYSCKNLIFLEIPPDENVFYNIIKKSEANIIYLAFNSHEKLLEPLSLLKRLFGMLKYIENQKNGIIGKTEIESVLGINRTTLIYALETLSKTGFLEYKQNIESINVKILNSTKSINTELIEYNLFLGELKQITDFSNYLSSVKINELTKTLNNKYSLNIKIKEELFI